MMEQLKLISLRHFTNYTGALPVPGLKVPCHDCFIFSTLQDESTMMKKQPIMNLAKLQPQLIDWGVFGLMMERRRVFVNLSQQQLAQKIGLPHPSIVAAEKGAPLCTNSFLKLCAWYGIEPKMFYAAALQTKRAKLMQSEAV